MAADKSALFKYWLIIRRRWLPSGLAFLIVLGLVVANTLSKPNIYRARGELSFDLEESSTSLTGLSAADQLPWSRRWNSKVKLEKAIRVLSSTPLLQRLASQLPADKHRELRTGLKITSIEETNGLNLTFDSVDPQLAAQIINQLMQIYVDYDLQKSRATLTSSREFIATQLPQVRQRLRVAESALRQFKDLNRTTGLEGTKELTVAGATLVQGQLSEVAQQLSGVEAQISDLQQKLGLDAPTAVALSAPAAQNELQRLTEVKNQLKVALTQFQPEHPQVVELLEQQQRLRGSLRNEVSAGSLAARPPGQPPQTALLDRLIELETNRKGLLQQQATLSNQERLYQQQANALIDQLPGIQQQQRELERDIKAAESTYETLLQRLEEIKVTEKQTIPAVQVVEPAQVPGAPVGPNRLAGIIRGVVGGLLLAAVVAYLLELCDRKLKSIDEIQEIYPETLLSVIPTFKATSTPSSLSALDNPQSPDCEAFRMLQVQLKFLRSDLPVRVIAITSAQPQEGKSTTCANLAVVLAQMGHRVLLVDVDMRRPTQHQIWSVSNAYGLSHILTATEEATALSTHTVIENLELLTAGMIPPNPLALLDSERMAAFVKTQRSQYDYILLDTPPVLAAADPLVLGRIADGILLVARPKVLEKHSAQTAWNTLTKAELNVLGVVINGVVPENEGPGYYAYYNYYNQEESPTETALLERG